MLSCGNQSRRKEILDHPTQLLGENTNCDSNAGERDKDSSSTSDSGMQAEASSSDSLAQSCIASIILNL